MSFNSDDIDPGVRDWVLRIRSFGFITTDSGDGTSKAVDGVLPEGAVDYPHVHMTCTRETLLDEADRLLRVVMDGGSVQASYDPVDGSALLSFFPHTEPGE